MFNRLHASDFMEKAHDVMTDSKEAARTGAQEIHEFMHEKPLLATMIGAGAGLLFGLLFGGRRRSPEASTPHRTAPRLKSRKRARA